MQKSYLLRDDNEIIYIFVFFSLTMFIAKVATSNDMRILDEVNSALKKSYFQLQINGNIKYMHK
jgi:transcriptional/translational regulatory protein YebC/TACO1